MPGLYNKDSSFFEIRSPDVAIDEVVHTKHLISLTVEEKMLQMTQGTLKLHDPNHVYSRVLRIGARLRIAWGFKNADASPQSLLTSIQNLDEFSDQIERRGLEVRIDSPGGAGMVDGNVTYDCNFTALQWRGDENVRVFASGTRAGVVHQVLDELGVSRNPTKRDVRFFRGADVLTDENAVRQTESNFAFLTRMASREWRTLFAMNYDQAGELCAMFIDPELIGRSPYQSAVMGAFGRSSLLDYKGLVSNVISYTWRNNAGRSGTGDSAQLTIVNGEPVFVRYNAETQTIVTWQLQTDRIEAELEDADSVKARAALTRDVLSATDFSQVQRFFKPIEQTTAPQGYGYEMSAKMLGNPMMMAGNLVEFGAGFPDVLGSSQTNWYARNVSHSTSQAGYLMTVGVVDAYSFSPTGTVL